ncbi:hypothetical protein HK099_001843 [Clydaea vesicula]|uniref:Uncharacterized protein n=1 Tax=Clydaea vesicula TaxID=447962 RepID=A0AAD5U346_9FUNG|nr:hypothetical protein HK099_001843 [Clydaea vesicula]
MLLSHIAFLLALCVQQLASQTAEEPITHNDCSTNPTSLDYNLSMRIAGVFIVLVVSGLGIFSIILLGFNTNNATLAKILQLLKMFGIGVIAATAWIHLLPEAFASFTNPCLSPTWAVYGPGFVGVFGLLSAYLVQLIELLAHNYMNHKHSNLKSKVDLFSQSNVNCNNEGNENQLTVASVIPKGHADEEHATIEANSKVVTTIVLETGILFHSLIIGLTLGVVDNDSFTILLIAVSFHQFFEGMALGVLIGGLQSVKKVKKFLGLGLVYPLTTPLGIVIGILIHKTYNENIEGLILFNGIFESLSAGILFYNTYAELMSLEINNNLSFHGFSKFFKFLCFFSMYLGSAAMAIIGIWA